MDNFTIEQMEFIKAEGKNVVQACPGSGKTYIVANKLLRYIKNWTHYHKGVAALSFTNVASKEISEQTQKLIGTTGTIGYPHFIGTVDSFINTFIVLQYGYLYTAERIRPQITLKDNWKLPYKYWRTDCYRKGCVDSIEDFHYTMSGELYKGKSKVNCNLHGKQTKLPCEQYKQMLRKKNIVFENEVPLFAYKLLCRYPVIIKALVERFPVIIIDEAQDTSEEQMQIFDKLIDGGITSFFLVGDPDQAIYEWRSATPQCFTSKKTTKGWNFINLTGNFRSSQNICNVTRFFSSTLYEKKPSKALGKYRSESAKPVLLLINNKEQKEMIIDYFFNKCKELKIEIKPENVAILTRSRIYVDTDINGLWKSRELEWFAQSVYEWHLGSRRKAYLLCSRAAFAVSYGAFNDDIEMNKVIDNDVSKNIWVNYIVDILTGAPSVNTSISLWVDGFKIFYNKVIKLYEMNIHESKKLDDIFKIKKTDKNVPEFRNIEMRKFFEKRCENNYTRSSVHGVKGETFDAVLLYIKSSKGNTITPTFLENGDLDDELMRIAYVAMTRPRKLLMIAMPERKGVVEYERFPKKLWDYDKLK